MPQIEYKGNVLAFGKELKEAGVLVTSMAYTTEAVYVETSNMGTFNTKKGEFIDIPEKLQAVDVALIGKWTIGKDTPLAPVFIAYTEDPENALKTFDDFYDDIGIPEEERSDFATAAMLKQVEAIDKALAKKEGK